MERLAGDDSRLGRGTAVMVSGSVETENHGEPRSGR